jgi:dTDP-glucose 4,6-dehydratase
MKTILVTGGAGFIGSNFVNFMLKHRPDDHIVVLDALTYAGNLGNFHEDIWDNPRFSFRLGNIKDRETVEECVREADVVLHLAAQTHVDNSILWCDEFINTNIKGTQILLDACKKHPVERFIYVSSSEVYGSARTVPMSEQHPLNPQSPYAGTKAGADRLTYAYFRTYQLPVVILRPFNNYGPNQHTEKLIPCFVTRALQDRTLPLHGDGSPTRDWVHTRDTCRAFLKAIETESDRVVGQVINIGSGAETTVKQITLQILECLGKPTSLIELLPDRRGQVRRHFASADRAKELLGWETEIAFAQGLDMTIQWYVENRDWWMNLKSFSGKRPILDAEPFPSVRAHHKSDVQQVHTPG